MVSRKTVARGTNAASPAAIIRTKAASTPTNAPPKVTAPMVRATKAKPIATTAAGNPLKWKRLVTNVWPVSHDRRSAGSRPSIQHTNRCSASHKSSRSNELAYLLLDNLPNVLDDAVPEFYAHFSGGM